VRLYLKKKKSKSKKTGDIAQVVTLITCLSSKTLSSISSTIKRGWGRRKERDLSNPANQVMMVTPHLPPPSSQVVLGVCSAEDQRIE
jgi:hypothetical protein